MHFGCSAIIFALSVISVQSFSQSYSEVTGTQLEAKKFGAVATGDLNNDGYLDIVTTGINGSSELSTTIYTNNADGTFSKLDVLGLTPMYNSQISLGDYNNDGHLDILLSGEGYDPLCTLWKNNGDLTFSLVDSGLDPLGGYNNAEMRDIDNDGDIDLLTAGMIRNGDGSYSSDLRLYKNVGTDQFQRQELAFTSYANVGTMGDYDSDGDLDLLAGGNWLEVYPNRGDGTFSSPKQLPIPFPIGQLKWFDQNNDGNLDFIASGRGAAADEYYTDVYLNSGGAEISFSKLAGTTIASAMRQNLDVRDYNSDGKADVLFTGMVDIQTNEFITTVYDNTGESFHANASIRLPQLGGGDVEWFDVDNDGDLDILMTGELVAGANVPKAIIMRNDAGSNNFSPNAAPTPPADVEWTYSAENGTVMLAWAAGSGSETPVAGLTYNVAIGSTTGGVDVLSPESNIESGKRLINRIGNAEMNRHKSVVGLNDGIYYFQVQSIDGALAGSAFSAPERFAVGTPEAPSGLTVLANENDLVISWQDNSVNEFEFIVEAQSHLDEPFKILGRVGTDTVSFAVDDLTSGTYALRIKAVNPNGESVYIQTTVAVGVPELPPVLSIEVHADDVHLTWDDASNEMGYVIERSLDDEAFKVIATLERDVTTFIDSPPSGLHQYRLKTLNSNGESAYVASAKQLVVGVESEASDPILQFFPNPVNNHLWIQGDAALLEKARFYLYTTHGQRIPIALMNASIDLHALKEGVYFLKAFVGDRVVVRRIVVE